MWNLRRSRLSVLRSEPECAKRPEVARAVVLLHAGEREARERIVEVHLHEQEFLVVAEADVVARAVFLDQLALEQKRLGLALDRVRLEVPDAFEQRLRSCGRRACWREG